MTIIAASERSAKVGPATLGTFTERVERGGQYFGWPAIGSVRGKLCQP
jgi:hypothetical protein